MRRTATEKGPNPISNSEVRSWAALNGISLAPWEAEVLDGLEQLYLAHRRAQ